MKNFLKNNLLPFGIIIVMIAAIGAVSWQFSNPNSSVSDASYVTKSTSQVQPDWNSSSGLGHILNQPSLSGFLTSASSLAWSKITGAPSFITGIAWGQITGTLSSQSDLVAALAAKFTIPTGTIAQVVLGNGTVGAVPGLPAAWVFNTSPGRSIVTGTGAVGFQPSSTRIASVSYSVTVSTTATIGTPANGYIVLEEAATNSATPSAWFPVGAQCGNSQNITLAALLSSAQGTTCQLAADVPIGYFVKIRSVTVSGSPTYTYNNGQEVLK